MFNRERVILTIEPQAILWYRGIVLYGSIGLPQAKFTNALTLGTICVRQSAYRSNDGAIPRYESCWPCWRRRGSLPALQATLPRHSHPKPAARTRRGSERRRGWAERVRPNSQLWLSGFTATSYFDFASSSPQPAFRAEPIGRALSGPSTSCPQKQTRVSARHAIESSLRSTPNSQTPDWYAKGGPAVSQWTAAGQFPPPFDLVETRPVSH